LSAEVSRIAENTQWNGTNILDGARTNTVFQIGANANQTIAVNFGDLSTNNATGSVTATNGSTSVQVTLSEALASDDSLSYKVTAADGTSSYATVAGSALVGSASNIVDVETDSSGTSNAITTAITASANSKVLTIPAGQAITISDVQITRGTHAPVAATDITSRQFATRALDVLDTAIGGVNSTRAGLGASMSRLEYASDNLQNVSQNTSAARSRVLDADYAAETTELARTQIIQQASTAMLSQANQAQQSVLALLK
jgi:flagellin